MLFPNRILLLALVMLLTACQPVPRSDPVPTPVIWEVQYSPTLSWLGPDFSACVAEQPHASIVVFEKPAQSLHAVDADFAFRWGAPSELQSFAAVVGWDKLTFIVHPDNPIETLSQSDVIDLYAGTIRSWNRFNPADAAVTGRVRLWTYPEGNDVLVVFSGLMNDSEQGDAVLYLAPDPQAMLQAVSEDPLAIGFIPRRWLDGSVRAVDMVDVDEALPRQPILAISQAEPQGDRRAWLLCVQERLNIE
jgi:hypothetical protein